ncbi:MAG: phytase, partial [Abditibacteriales bacterium]|nr:phytase [Abditibacteriales bacterium]MDW8366992.1 phytase [Abditibacteriales bacterium]
KDGPKEGYLWQYRLEGDGSGKIRATKVRAFGAYSGFNEIEAVAVDDALGYVYYADENYGIRKWHADPEHPEAHKELAVFGRTDFAGDHEGIGIYARTDGTGYLVCADQLPGESEFQIYRREGRSGQPHHHTDLLKAVRGGADACDGIEVVSTPLGPQFPHGIVVAMNSRGRNFLLYGWEDFARTGAPPLRLAQQ